MDVCCTSRNGHGAVIIVQSSGVAITSMDGKNRVAANDTSEVYAGEYVSMSRHLLNGRTILIAGESRLWAPVEPE